MNLCLRMCVIANTRIKKKKERKEALHAYIKEMSDACMYTNNTMSVAMNYWSNKSHNLKHEHESINLDIESRPSQRRTSSWPPPSEWMRLDTWCPHCTGLGLGRDVPCMRIAVLCM